MEEFARFRHLHWDVVVVDEVQMVADPQRGWAWVDALVSAHTPQLMMTGPALIQPSLRTLCELCEDKLVVQRTKRLSPVEVARHATTLQRLEPGSLLVAFSRKLVLELKGMLESAGKSVSVVYGALSPEVRREQARRFREGEADIMVATDAVGMGLNLPAHTLCFYTDEKFDGIQNRQLKVQEVKQIGGRAGRFGHHDSGEITALDPQTLKSIRRLFNSPDAPVDLSQFQVRPSIDHLAAISELMGELSLLRAWLTFNRNINYGEAFISVLPDELAEWIELIDDPKIPLWLRWTFACTPIRGAPSTARPVSMPNAGSSESPKAKPFRCPSCCSAAIWPAWKAPCMWWKPTCIWPAASPSIFPSTTTVKTRASCSTTPSPVNCHASANRGRFNGVAAARPAESADAMPVRPCVAGIDQWLLPTLPRRTALCGVCSR